MRWTIALTAAGVLLAAGIAGSQQPPGNNPPNTIRAATPPGADVAVPNAPAVPSGPGGYAVIGLPPGQTATFALPHPPVPYGVARSDAFADPETAELNRLDHQLEQESRTLVNQLAQAPEDDANARDQLKQKLRDTLERQFEAQQKIRETEVTRIEARVKKLREMIDKRNGARRTIVDRRQQQLMDDAEGFGWSSAGAADPNAAMNSFGTFPVTHSPVSRLPTDPFRANPAALRPAGAGEPLPNVATPAAAEAPASLPSESKRP